MSVTSSSLKQQLLDINYETDIDRIAVLLRFIIISLSVAALLIFCIASYFEWLPTIIISGANALIFGCLSLVRFKQHIGIVSIVVVLCIWASITYLIAQSDGIHDVGIMLYPLTLTIGSLIFNRLYFISLTVLCVGAIGIVGTCEVTGIIESKYTVDDNDVGDVIVATVLVALSGFIIRLLTEYSLTALQRAFQTESQYREIFNNLHDAVFILDKEQHKIIDVNETMLNMYGYQRHELADFVYGIEGDEQYSPDHALEHMQLANEQGSHQFHWKAVKKDGSSFWVDVILNKAQIGGHERIVAVIRNIDQEFRLEEQLRQSEKLTAIGELAGGIAHDFNNMLAGIMGAAEVLALNKLQDDHQRLVDMIIRTSERAGELTQKLLTFSKKRDLVLEPVELHSIIHDVLEILSRSVSKTITLETTLRAEHRTVQGDRAELINLFLNLGVNACDAMGEKGSLHVRTENYTRDEQDAPDTVQGLQAGPHIRISVQDTGSGIPADIQQRIFEPFFSTKDKSQRTGLGLAAVYGATGKHNGLIRIADTSSKGTTFEVHLPLIDDVLDNDDHLELQQDGEGVILIVDDEQSLLTTTSMILERAGYQCITARNGAEALNIYQKQQQNIDLVLLDMLMPDMSGKECFYEMRKQFPNVQIMICSGFTEDHSVSQLIEDGAIGFIKKPYRMHELLQEIQQALSN